MDVENARSNLSTPSDVRPAQILSYSGPTPRPISVCRELLYERNGNDLLVSIPPPSYRRQIVVRGLYIAACLPVAAIMFFSVAFIVSDMAGAFATDKSADGVLAIVACLFLLLLIVLIGKLILHIRNGRSPSFVMAGPSGVEVRTAWLPRSQPFVVLRENIVDVRVNPGGAAFSPACFLEITTRDDRLLIARIPWPKRHPMIELEDNLRDVLGLGPGN